MSCTVDRMVSQANWDLLTKKGFRFIEMDEDTLRIQTHNKSLDIVYDRETDRYNLTEHIIRRDPTVKTRQIDGVCYARLKAIIAKFFNIRKDRIITGNLLIEEIKIECPNCGSNEVEVGIIAEEDPTSECWCKKCSYEWLEY